MKLYTKYSDYLRGQYGEKIYKLPINLNVSCPNRDGTIGTGGCHFCSLKGTGFESLDASLSVKTQLTNNMAYIGKRYGAKKFIAFFQNYTNTHMPIEDFSKYIEEACIENIVEIGISTRPDCISKPYLDQLLEITNQAGVNVSIELGLQTVHDKSLLRINRGHLLKDYRDAVELIREYPFSICTHFILNLPWDSQEHVVQGALLMNELKIEQVKLHALYIAKDTVFERMFNQNAFEMGSKEDYINRVILFLIHLNPQIVIQRLIGRAPEEDSVFCNWGESWWKIHDEIELKMKSNNLYQGKML